MKIQRIAPGLALAGALACASTSTSGESLNPQPTNVTEFHVSVFNACTDDVTLLVGTSQQSGRKVLLFKTSRDSFAGTNESVWLLDEKEQPIALYQPIQGNQKLRVTADCTGLQREP
ncbi:MAG: hypothetical protein H6710_13035 [Myxococcales bacterium]|nr:hypothetical protein [Myxococcales bacterium]MCB9705339.1 hypothetical protein [Myxococcales bacterium]